jgi:hypothetical protein
MLRIIGMGIPSVRVASCCFILGSFGMGLFLKNNVMMVFKMEKEATNENNV